MLNPGQQAGRPDVANVPYMFTLEVDGFDLEDEDVVSRFSADSIEAYPASADGQVTITYNLLSDDPIDAVLDAINHLKRFGTDISVLRVLPDLVNIGDIASRIEAPRDTVRSWVTSSRGPGNFPQSYATIGRGVKIWDWSAVNEWLRAHHPDLAEDEYFLSREQIDRINASIARKHWKTRGSGVWLSEDSSVGTQTASPQTCICDHSYSRMIAPLALSSVFMYSSSLGNNNASIGTFTEKSFWLSQVLSPIITAPIVGTTVGPEFHGWPVVAGRTSTNLASSSDNSSTSLFFYQASEEGDQP
jgi:hypothetical protein